MPSKSGCHRHGWCRGAVMRGESRPTVSRKTAAKEIFSGVSPESKQGRVDGFPRTSATAPAANSQGEFRFRRGVSRGWRTHMPACQPVPRAHRMRETTPRQPAPESECQAVVGICRHDWWGPAPVRFRLACHPQNGMAPVRVRPCRHAVIRAGSRCVRSRQMGNPMTRGCAGLAAFMGPVNRG